MITPQNNCTVSQGGTNLDPAFLASINGSTPREPTTIAGGRIHIAAPIININGVIQSGRDHYVLQPQPGWLRRKRWRSPPAADTTS